MASAAAPARRWTLPLSGSTREGEAGDQEGDGEDDADVEEVDEAVERVAGVVVDAAVAAEADPAHARAPAGAAIGVAAGAVASPPAPARSRSSVYMRVRASVRAKATVPTSRPTTVAPKASRRFSASDGDVAVAERGEPGRERDQRAHQPDRRAGADEQAGAVEAPLDRQLVAGQRALGDGGAVGRPAAVAISRSASPAIAPGAL